MDIEADVNTGNDHGSDGPMSIEDNNAFLMAMGAGSRIEIHAADASKESWTQLSENAYAGDRVLQFTEDTGWEIGDKIAIAPSGQDHTEDEERTILSISDDGKTVTLDRPLEFDHYGELESYSNGSTTWEVDMRAEVALLSRNITIQGDENSAQDGFGAHTMVMDGAEQHISGAEFFRVGQEDILGRYPIHWHMLGDASGQYVTNISVHQSYQKGATIHGTSNVLFEGNVIFDHVGHGFFMEDGSETENVIFGNLVFGTHASQTGEPIPTDRTEVASYWIENVSNTFIGNHAAGSENVGFFIAPATETGPHGESDGMNVRNNADDFYFVGNTASSSEFGVFLDGHIDGETLEHVNGQNFSLDGSLWFEDVTAYANREVGLWSFKGNGSDNYVVVTDAKIADNASNLEVRGDDFLFTDSVSIGESGNIAADKNVANIGVKTYRNSDAAMVDVHFANFDNHRDDIAISLQEGELKDYGDNFQDMTFQNVDNELVFRDITALLRPDDAFNTVARDDGSLTGVEGGAWITRNIPGELERSGYNSYVDPNLDNAFVTTEGAMGVTEFYLFGKRADQQKEITVTRSVDGLKFEQDSWLTREGRGGEDLYQFITPTADDQEAAFLVELGGPANIFPTSFNLSLDGIRVGEAVVYEIPNVASFSSGFSVNDVNSMGELFAADSTSAFVQGGSLFVRVVGMRANNESYLGSSPDDQIFGEFMGTESPGGIAISFDITSLHPNNNNFQEYGEATFDPALLSALGDTDGYESTNSANTDLILPDGPVAHEAHESTSSTVVVMDHTARWSDVDAWDGAVPGPQDIIVIGPGQTIVLDQSATVKGIIVNGGNLIVEDAPGGPQNEIMLVSDYVLVINGGLFQAGTEEDPLDRDFTLELTGDDPEFDLHVTDILNGTVANTLFAMSGNHEHPGDDHIESPVPPLPVAPVPVVPDNVIHGTSDDDTVTGTNDNDELYGYAGNDLVRGGAGHDTAFGGAGDDNLQGGEGNDILDAGSGNDYLAGAPGDDVVIGGAGDDEVYGDAGDDVLYGGSGADTVGGGEGDDVLYGGNGDDNLVGGIGDHSGNDTLFGGLGADVLNGGAGNDIYVYETALESTANSRDLIRQFSVTDDKFDLSALEVMNMDELTITIAGNQTIVRHNNSVLEFAIQGQHTLQASNFVFAEPEEANGSVSGRVFADENSDGSYQPGEGFGVVPVVLYQGDQAIVGTTTNQNGWYMFDDVQPGTGYFVRFMKFNELDFVPDDGQFVGGGENLNSGTFEVVPGGSVGQMNAVVAMSLPAPVVEPVFGSISGSIVDEANVGVAAALLVLLDANGDTVASTMSQPDGSYDFELLLPGQYHVRATESGEETPVIEVVAGQDTVIDALTVDIAPIDPTAEINLSDGDNQFDGTPEVDTVNGEGGDDVMWGRGEADTLSGGDGDDILRGGQGDDVVQGDAGGDVISGDRGVDYVEGGAGADIARGGADDDQVYGGDGNDLVVSGDAGNDLVHGGAGNDVARGGAGDDQVYGDGGNDRLVGDLGNDQLFGGAGDDVLIGHFGDDYLIGGAGFDRLIGGDGADVYAFEAGGGRDVLVGFEVGVDKIDISAYDALTAEDVLSQASEASAGGVKLDFGDGDSAIIRDVELNDLSAGDFIVS